MTHAVVGMFGVHALASPLVLAESAEGEVATYFALFVLEVVGWMGVPVVGTAALTAAAVLAAKGCCRSKPSSSSRAWLRCSEGCWVTGPAGVGGGSMQHPGRGEERRKKTLARGTAL